MGEKKRPEPDDMDDFISKWDSETEKLVDRIADRFPVLSLHEVSEIVLESITLGVAINEDAARRATQQVLNAPDNPRMNN